MTGYLLSSGICVAVFYLFYILIVRKDNHFTFNRLYLIATIFLSFTIPLLNIPLAPRQAEIPSVIYTLQTVDVVISGTEQKVAPMFDPYLTLIWGVYLLGFTLAGIRFGVRLIKIRYLLHHKDIDYQYFKGAWIIDTLGSLPTFSFMEYIFFDSKSVDKEEDKNRILQHELAHVLQGHTYDMLVMEILKVIFWFNPLLYLYSDRLEETHEYLADHYVVNDENRSGYIELLARMALQNISMGFVRQFSKSRTLNRIRMIQLKPKQKIRWSMLGFLPLTLLLVFIFSCERLTSGDELAFDNSNQIVAIPEGDFKLSFSKTEEEGQDYTRIIGNTIEARVGEWIITAKEIDTPEKRKTIEDFIQKMQENTQGDDLAMTLPQTITVPKSSTNSSGIYDVFELAAQPEYPNGGMAAFYRDISSQLKYPSSARSMGIEGKVFLLFVIDVDGSVKDVEVIKGIHPDCDMAAMEAIKNTGPWIPGQQGGQNVPVRMRVPITFKLG